MGRYNEYDKYGYNYDKYGYNYDKYGYNKEGTSGHEE